MPIIATNITGPLFAVLICAQYDLYNSLEIFSLISGGTGAQRMDVLAWVKNVRYVSLSLIIPCGVHPFADIYSQYMYKNSLDLSLLLSPLLSFSLCRNNPHSHILSENIPVVVSLFRSVGVFANVWNSIHKCETVSYSHILHNIQPYGVFSL